MRKQIDVVCDLSEVLSGVGPCEPVYAQVVAEDGSSWYMALTVGKPFGKKRGLVITMHHPGLKTLPELESTK